MNVVSGKRLDPDTFAMARRPSKALVGMWTGMTKQAGPEERNLMTSYVAVIARTRNGYGAHVPDLPGCVAADDTLDQTEELIREAVGHHVEMLRENGDPVPEPQITAHVVPT